MNTRERVQRIARLLRTIQALEYRVESFGDLGAQRELEALRVELRTITVPRSTRSGSGSLLFRSVRVA